MRRFLLLLALLAAAPVHAADVLNVYNWSEYMPERVLTLFTGKTGIKVNYVTYESNEEMYEQVKANPGAYDLVIPSTYYVSKMRKEGLLRKLDKGALTNLGNLDSRLLNQAYDPNNEHSLPYLWGSTVLFVDTAYVKEPVTSVKDLWRPEFRGKVLLPDDMREVFGLALSALGHSTSSTDPKEIEAAYRKLVELQPNVAEYNSDTPKDAIMELRATVGATWNGEVYQARQERHSVECVYPQEGAALWIDSVAIPVGAKNVKAAHQFIDFIMRPGVAAMIAEAYGYASPNRAALREVDLWVRGSNIVYPDDETLKRAQIHLDVGDALPLYEKYWAQLRGEE
ncbi:MAG: PotD/PotF family extracellular solute-binding protein [Thiohalomonadaceae bacterium]